jgi:hypothetical protein
LLMFSSRLRDYDLRHFFRNRDRNPNHNPLWVSGLRLGARLRLGFLWDVNDS